MVAPMISSPPMEGVPFLEKCDCGPSIRISWPICRFFRLRMSSGPKMKLTIMAVIPARAVRTVM